MKVTLPSLKKVLIVLILISITDMMGAQEIASFSRLQNSACSGTINADANITTNGVCRGPGIAQAGGTNYNSNNWTFAFPPALDPNDYLEWSITPNAGYQIDLNSIDLNYFRSGNGPNKTELQADFGSGFVTLDNDPLVTANGNDINSVDLSTYSDISNTITFRLFAYGAGNNSGQFAIRELIAATNKGVIINGNVELIPCPTITTWDGTAWDNGTPTLALGAVLNGNYDTGIHGNLTTCNLAVNAGSTLTVSDNTYLEVDNDIVVDGVLNVASNGSVVQNSNTALVVENGTITVTKQTAPLDNWYEYTYWSSPVINETVGSALSQTQPSRRFTFNALNFEDSFRETNNDNTQVPGQDDIDDDGNDWTYASGTDVMTPGVGFATTHAEALFIGPPMSSPPYQFDYIFSGPFNNGDVLVPVYRNDSEIMDINWNFIGNPYPSAIDVDLFLNENVTVSGILDGALYLWSQDTPPSETENGNEQLNFTQSDYALINGAGETAGGEGVVPSRFIPSGQGFFVSFSDALPSNTGNVVFNNSMRVTGNNNQFFRNSPNGNTEKIRLNLNSDNGVFNQILVSYVPGATNTFDGFYYDAPRNLSTGASSILYSIIDNNDKKFAIQGRDPNSIDENEIIQLGFYTSIDVPTIYTLSLSEHQGTFIESNPILLRDNLLNTTHDLKQSNYSFTSSTGEFNDRFEIVFNASALSTNDLAITPDLLNITELNSGEIKISVSNNLNITSVEILDLLGRTVYLFEGNSSSEVYDISKLSRSPYLAKVSLSNGQIMSKKAIKQF